MMLFNLVLLIILIICVITDLKNRKIYNLVIFPGILLAFGLHAYETGWTGLGFSVLGFLAGLGILLIPYLLGGMGAGDVKLLALIGALKGTSFVLFTAFYMAILGGIIALGILLFRKGLLKSLLYSFYTKRYGMKMSDFFDKQTLKVTYPYGVAIAGGALCSLFLKGMNFL